MLFFCFFNDTATTEIYTLSLHDALPIPPSFRRPGSAGGPTGCVRRRPAGHGDPPAGGQARRRLATVRPDGRQLRARADRKSTRLNSSHANISYAVFCLKKKNNLILSNLV